MNMTIGVPRWALVFVFLLGAGITPVIAAESGQVGADYNISLITDSAPDLTDVDSYLRSITSQYAAPQEKAIAVWRWSQRLRKQMTNPMECGSFVLDPVEMFNSYGYCNCGIVSGVNNALWLNLGWKAHYVQLGDHTVCETSWDNGKTWHMFDSSMSFYCFNDEGAVASVREIEKNPRFYLENFAPEVATNPVHGIDDQRGWRNASDGPVRYERTLANGYDSFKPPNDITDANLYAQWGSRYVLNLRPGEQYTRYFRSTGDVGATAFRPVHGNKDVDENKVIRANGIWHYAPDLRDPATRDLIYSDSGVKWTTNGVSGPGEVVFKVAAANAVTSSKISAGGDGIALSVSADAGINWKSQELKSGSVECRDPIAGMTEYLVKVNLTGEHSSLSSLSIETITQLNRPGLPRLSRGPNHVRVSLGQQLETIQFKPTISHDGLAQTAFSQKAVDIEHDPGFYKPTLRPAEKDAPCHVTWRIQTPTPIIDVTYGGTICVKNNKDRVTLLHSWDDKTYSAYYQKNDDSTPWDKMINAGVSSIPPEVESAYLRYEFQTVQQPKQYFGPGIQMASMLIHHQPRVAKFVPIEATYCWIEHRDSGDLERQHTQIITSPTQDYTINVGGFRDPTMKWVRMNLQGSSADGAPAKAGYSDGVDVGPDAKANWALYHWGKNLALGKPYTLEGKTDARNPDAGGDLTDDLIAPPDTYVSAKYMPTNVMFANDVSPVVTVDLGSVQTAAGVRVHAGQEGGFHLSYPDSIAVETSADGKTFTPAGSAGFKQVFEPPADFVPWELDQSSLFDDLPAGGRLAYAYRIIFDKPVSARFMRIKCAARKGWGMLLSEVQVFDRVSVDKNVPPLVVIPAMAEATHWKSRDWLIVHDNTQSLAGSIEVPSAAPPSPAFSFSSFP